MKIELTCPDCQSVIRVDGDHAGKQVRCPVCSCITQIPQLPVDGEVVSQGASPPESDRRPERPKPPEPDSTKWVDPPTAPTSPVSNQRHIPPRARFDQRFGLALMWGVGSIVANFVCCGPIVGGVLGVIGLGNAVFSKSRYKQSGIVLNLIGLAIATAMIGLKYFLHWWATG